MVNPVSRLADAVVESESFGKAMVAYALIFVICGGILATCIAAIVLMATYPPLALVGVPLAAYGLYRAYRWALT